MADLPSAPDLTESAAATWHSRGYHPHFDSPDVVQHVAIHLADSLPTAVVERLAAQLIALPPDRRPIERHRSIQAWLAAGHGCCLLREPWAASLVQSALLHFDAHRYRLLAWVVMPNHVHVVLQMLPGWQLRGAVASWKSYTGRRLAASMPDGRRAWLREYYDRYVRDATHYDTVIAYVANNPVKAGLVDRADAWPWSSAYQGGA